MIKKISLPLLGILTVGSTVFGAYEVISSLPISTTDVNENTLSGTAIADLSTIGGEGPYDYYLTMSGAGIDNDKFYISGGKLYLNFNPDYENPTDSGTDNKYTIEIKTIDSSKPVKYSKDFSNRFTSPGGYYGDGITSSMYFVNMLMKDSSIYAAGPDFDGYLKSPEETGFVDVVINQRASAGLKSDGSIVTWGKIGSGGTGGPTGDGYTKIYASTLAFAALHQDGSIYAWGVDVRGGVGAPTDTGYTKISSNSSGFAALRADGSVYSRGSVYTGNQPTDTGFVDIIGNGAGAFAALKANGTIKSWGNTAKGGLGAPTATGFISIAGNGNAFAALKTDGSIVAWGDAARGGTSPTGTGYTKIYGGGQIFVAVKADGSVKSWGAASYIAGSPSVTGFVKLYVGNWTNAGLKDNGLVYAWGYGAYGGSGAPTRAGFVDVAGNYYAMAALHEDGSVVSWGDVAYGGSGAPTGTGFIKLFSTYNGFAVLHEDGRVIYRGGDVNENPYRMGASYKTTYDIEILDVDDTAPIGTVEYTELNKTVKATLQLNESGVVTNNGGSFDYIFTETGSFTFEFADLAGNTGSVIATVDRVGGDGGGVSVVKDDCPNGDNSPSYYDRSCGVSNTIGSSSDTSGDEEITVVEPIVETSEPTWEKIYQWAKTNGLTTMPDYISARLGDPITRGELSKVMVNYFKDKELDTTKICEFTDIQSQTEEIQEYIKKACQIGIMGVNIEKFNPDGYVSRAEFATILSRAMWGNMYENSEGLYYEKHMNILKQKSILNNTEPNLQEMRAYVFLMLMRM